jgi:hypothetical protein
MGNCAKRLECGRVYRRSAVAQRRKEALQFSLCLPPLSAFIRFNLISAGQLGETGDVEKIRPVRSI